MSYDAVYTFQQFLANLTEAQRRATLGLETGGQRANPPLRPANRRGVLGEVWATGVTGHDPSNDGGGEREGSDVFDVSAMVGEV
jgi:hypothetical protein